MALKPGSEGLTKKAAALRPELTDPVTLVMTGSDSASMPVV